MDYCWPSLKNVTALAAALFAASLVVGCSDETGVLVEVTREPSTTPADIERLELIIGVSRASDPANFVKDASSAASISVVGRDLATSPYELLMRNGAGEGALLMVAVVAFKGDKAVGFAGFDPPQGFVSGQVLKRQLELKGNPMLRRTDSGCISWLGPDDVRRQIGAVNDQDCDGDLTDGPGKLDCDDHNPDIGPSRTEVCANQIDDNCNDMIDEETDIDLDGMTNCKGDCDDNDPLTFKDAVEICDGKDNDCNTRCDDGILDGDGDNFNTCADGEKILVDGSCQPGFPPDCDDTDNTINPDANEMCDGVDNDCDATCDVGPGIDVDMDGLTACGTIPGATCVGPAPQLIDCNDGDADVHPGAAEVCDGKDDNCDGVREIHEPCYTNTPGPECRVGSRNCDDDASNGTFGLDACLATDGNVIVPQGFCDAYATCEATTTPPPDWFTCANAAQATGNKVVKCTLFHTGLTLCPERQQPLPQNMLAQTCSWQIIGGKNQPHYNVGLVDELGGGTPQASLAVCKADFVVIDKVDFVARAASTYLQYDDDSLAAAQTIEVRIQPQFVTSCPQQGGLQCVVVGP